MPSRSPSPRVLPHGSAAPASWPSNGPPLQGMSECRGPVMSLGALHALSLHPVSAPMGLVSSEWGERTGEQKHPPPPHHRAVLQ